MLDLSFSAKNFRTILNIENKKGAYLEALFFPKVKATIDSIKKCCAERRDLFIEKKEHSFNSKEFKDIECEIARINVEIRELEKIKDKELYAYPHC